MEKGEIIEAGLPDAAAFHRSAPQRELLGVLPLAQARKQAPGKPLFDGLHDHCWIAALRFGEQQMNVLRHYDVSDHGKTVASPHLFQHAEKQVPISGGAQQWQALITAGGDEVRSIPPRSSDGVAWAWIGCSIEARRLAVTNEHEVEVRGAHLSKTTKGGATDCLLGSGENQSWVSPRAVGSRVK